MDGAAASPAAHAKLESLQMLRGIAAFMVLLYHTGSLYAVHTGQVLWGNIFRSGFSGVEVFFVLSGVVIFWVHGADIGRPERARNFLVRRAFRLFPVYWAVLLLKVAKDPGAISGASLLTAVLLLPASPPLINVSWTLTYELLFYGAFLAWIVLPLSRWGWPMLLLLGLSLVPAPAVQGASDTVSTWIAFLFNPHLTVFVFGVAVAWALKRHGAAPWRWAVALVVLGVCVFSAAAWAGTSIANALDGTAGMTAYDVAERQSNWVFDAGVFVFGIPAAMVIAGLLSLELQGRFKLPGSRVLIWLGDISYSLYLTHAFVIHLVLSRADVRRVAVDHPPVLLLVWGAALLVAWGLHRAVEVPAMAMGRRFAQRPGAAAAQRTPASS